MSSARRELVVGCDVAGSGSEVHPLATDGVVTEGPGLRGVGPTLFPLLSHPTPHLRSLTVLVFALRSGRREKMAGWVAIVDAVGEEQVAQALVLELTRSITGKRRPKISSSILR